MATLKISTNEQNFIAGLQKASGAVGAFAGTMNVKLASSFKEADFYTKNFEKGLGRLANSLKTTGQGMTVGLTLPLLLLSKSASDAYAEFDALRRALGTVEPTTQSLTSKLKELREVAKMPGIGFQEAIQGEVRLRSVGISADQSIRILREFANAIAMTGGGKAQLNEVTIQLGQMAAKGKVLAQDLRPIIEAAPAVATALKNIFGTVSSEAISKNLEQSGKSSTDMINMLLTELEKAPRVTGGWKNSLENLGDTLFIAKAEIFEVADSVFGLQSKIESVSNAVINFVEGFKELPEPIQRAILGITVLLTVLGPATYAIGLLTSAIASTVTAAGLMTMSIGGLVVILASLAFAIGSAYNEGVKLDTATQSLSKTYKQAEESIRGETSNLQKNVEVLRNSKSSIADVKTAKAELLKINPEFKNAINGDIINFEKLADITSKTADELLRVSKYQNLIKQKEVGVKQLEEMDKGKLSGLSLKQLYSAGLVGEALAGGGDGRDAYQEIKDQNAKKIKETIWFIDKTIEKEYGDLAKRNKEREKTIAPAILGNLGEGKKGKYANKIEALKAVIKEEHDLLKKQIENEENALKESNKNAIAMAIAFEESMNPANLPKPPEPEMSHPDLAWKTMFGNASPLKGMSDEEIKTWKEINEASMQGQSEYIRQFEDMKENLHNILGSLSIDFGSSLIEGLASGEGFKGAFSGLMNSLGNVMIDFGKKALVANNAFKAFKTAFNIAPGSSGATAKALGLIAGGAIMKGLSSKIPKLAQGGMATNPTLAMIGDNPSGKEMVLPFEKTGEFANKIALQMGGNGNFGGTLTTRISGRDLLILLERENRKR